MVTHGYGIRRVLRRGAENLTEHAWARLLAGIEAGDDHGQVPAHGGRSRIAPDLRLRDGEHAAARLYDWTVLWIDSG